MAAARIGRYFIYEFSRKSVDTLYCHLMELNSFSVKSTDSGQISFNNLGKVEKNVNKKCEQNVFIYFEIYINEEPMQKIGSPAFIFWSGTPLELSF